MPIFKYATKEEVPSDVQSFATQITEGDEKGQWSVNLVPRKSLEEFRDKNIEAAKKLEEAEGTLKKVFGTLGVKAEEFDADKLGEELTGLKDTARKVADGKLKASDDVDNELAKRTEALRNKADEQIREAKAEAAKWKTAAEVSDKNYRNTFIDRAVSAVMHDEALGVEPSALQDIVARAYNVFSVNEDNSLLPKKNGQTMWGEDGATPMTMKEWIDLSLRKEAPHYFKKSNGGGAGGGNGEGNLGGMSHDELAKLSPERRLEIANAAKYKEMGFK